MRQWMSNRRGTIVVCAVILLGALVYHFFYYRYAPLEGDEGHLVNSALRVLDGQLPLKDFYQTYAPGRYWALAFLFGLLGPSLAVERLMWVVVLSMANVLMFLAAKRNMPSLFAAIPVLMVMIVPGKWCKAPSSLLLLLNILMIYRYVGRFDRASLALCGFVVGTTVWFRQDVAGYAALTVLTCVVMGSILHLRSGEGKVLTRVRSTVKGALVDVLAFSSPLALSLVPLVLVYWLRSGLYEFVRRMSIGRMRSVAVLSTPFPSPWLIFSTERTSPPRTEIVFLYVVVLMLAVLTVFVLFDAARKIRKGERRYNWILFSTLVLAIPYFGGHTYPWAYGFRLPQDGALIYILGGYVIYRVYSVVRDFISGRSGSGEVGLIVGIVVTLILLFLPAYYVGYALVAEPVMGGGIPLAGESYVAIDSPRAGTYLPAEEAAELNEMLNYIGAHTDAEHTIFAFNNSQLYFLADRRNATRQDKIIPALAESWAAEQLLDDFRKNSPRLIAMRRGEAKRVLGSLPELLDEIAWDYEYDRKIGRYHVFRKAAGRSSVHSSLSIICQITGKRIEADVKAYRRILLANPEDQVARRYLAALYFIQGNIHVDRGETEEAIAAYQEAIEVSPSEAAFHEALGGLWRGQGRLEKAVVEFERAVALDPSLSAAYRGLGATYEGLERIEDATAAFEEAVRLSPSNAGYHLRLGRLYRDQGRLEEAAIEFKRAVALDPGLARAYWALGVTYEELGRIEGAIAAYREVVRLDPSFDLARRRLERLAPGI